MIERMYSSTLVITLVGLMIGGLLCVGVFGLSWHQVLLWFPLDFVLAWVIGTQLSQRIGRSRSDPPPLWNRPCR